VPDNLDQVPPHPMEKGFQRPLAHPYVFIDGCVQIWPDADFSTLNGHAVTASCITAFRPDDGPGNALEAIADWHHIAEAYDGVRFAFTAADIVAAKHQGQAAIVLASQGGDFLGQNIHWLKVFHRLGLRMMIPAYNARSALGDGCLEAANSGLSALGQAWVEECNRLGVLMDLTHTGERTTLDILERMAKPVVFSHSNPKALVDTPRAITDEQIKRCAATGGLIGVTNWGPLNFGADMTARPTLAHFLDALDYTIDKVGIDHADIGTDMSHGTYPDGDLVRNRPAATTGRYAKHVEGNLRSRLRHVDGFDDYGQLLDVVEAMHKRGLDEADVEKVLGVNWLRVFEQVWGGFA
jgi:membrane dipeptidase